MHIENLAQERFFKRVRLDKGDMIGTIIGVSLYPAVQGVRLLYQVGWWSSGVYHENWFEPFRIEEMNE